MSDRVAIIGGSNIERDYFPWPLAIYDGVALPNSQFPFGHDASNICKMFYTVRRWALTISATWKDTEGSHSGGVYVEFEPFILPDDGSASYTMSREAEIVMFRTTSWGWVNGEGYNFGGGTIDDSLVIFNESFTGEGLSDYAVTNEYTSPLFFDSAFYPDVEMFTSVNGDFSCQTHPIRPRVVGLLHYWTGATTNLTSGNLDVDGNGLLTCDIQLLPKKFWPYANRVGSPVWNETTGGLLTDPAGSGQTFETITQHYPTDLLTGVPQTLNVLTDENPWSLV